MYWFVVYQIPYLFTWKCFYYSYFLILYFHKKYKKNIVSSSAENNQTAYIYIISLFTTPWLLFLWIIIKFNAYITIFCHSWYNISETKFKKYIIFHNCWNQKNTYIHNILYRIIGLFWTSTLIITEFEPTA